MKISTKTGDRGKTKLMFGREVSKSCLRVRAYGAVDELSSSLGLARAFAGKTTLADTIFSIQKNLVFLMTELATAKEDFEKLATKSIKILDEDSLKIFEEEIEKLESGGEVFNGWKHSGENTLQAALDIARAKCRTAEREVVALNEAEFLPREFPIVYLNRLADLLWLMAQNAAK